MCHHFSVKIGKNYLNLFFNKTESWAGEFKTDQTTNMNGKKRENIKVYNIIQNYSYLVTLQQHFNTNYALVLIFCANFYSLHFKIYFVQYKSSEID